MANIMCTRRLWQALGNEGSPPVTEGPELHGHILGSWAAKSFKRGRRTLVLALNDRTYLPLLFPLAPRKTFYETFAQALETLLEDLRVPRAVAKQEASFIAHLPLARLSNRSITGSLNDLEFLAHCDLDYISDLREVQLRLTEVPHVKRTPSIPLEAVTELLRLREGATRIH